MAKYYYGGVLLPEIPADTLLSYPYCWLRNNDQTGYYDLVFAKSVWFSTGTSTINHNDSEEVKWYRIEKTVAEATEGWTFYQNYSSSAWGNETDRPIIWVNEDILEGSATSETVYFAATEPVPLGFKPSGTAVYSFSLGEISSYFESSISWTEEIPEGTSCTVSASLDDGEYTVCSNGESIPCLVVGNDYSSSTLSIRIELATTDSLVSPALSNLRVKVKDETDRKSIVLHMASRINNAAGAVEIRYTGGGNLQGAGGFVGAFTNSFTPTEMQYSGGVNDSEHMEISNIVPAGTLTKIFYSNAFAEDHIELSGITVSGVLTHIDDI